MEYLAIWRAACSHCGLSFLCTRNTFLGLLFHTNLRLFVRVNCDLGSLQSIADGSEKLRRCCVSSRTHVGVVLLKLRPNIGQPVFFLRYKQKQNSCCLPIRTIKKHFVRTKYNLYDQRTICTNKKHFVLNPNILYFVKTFCTLLKHSVLSPNIWFFNESLVFSLSIE